MSELTFASRFIIPPLELWAVSFDCKLRRFFSFYSILKGIVDYSELLTPIVFCRFFRNAAAQVDIIMNYLSKLEKVRIFKKEKELFLKEEPDKYDQIMDLDCGAFMANGSDKLELITVFRSRDKNKLRIKKI